MKNRVLRSALAVILVITMVLTMAACGDDASTPTTAPTTTPTTAPTTAPETEAPATEAPETEAPDEVVSTDEEALAEYGITFPESDAEYNDGGSFGLLVDETNKYQVAYANADGSDVFSYSMKVSAVDFDGKSLSTSKYTKFDADDANDTYVVGISGYSAGIYTVTYTVKVELDDDSIGYYSYDAVKETYTVVKTYEVAKAEIALSTSSDAYEVSSSMAFRVPVTEDDSAILTENTDYTVSYDMISCDGTEVGEFTLGITIKDKDGNAVEAEDIVLANYYVSVSEGTRYILSAAETAQVLAAEKIYEAFAAGTTEYRQEVINAYNALSAGQKQFADITASAIAEVEFNMGRADIVTAISNAITAYDNAAVGTKKDAALLELANLLLAVDNTAGTYGSDLLFILNTIETADGEVAGLIKYTEETDSDDSTLSYASFGFENDETIKVNYAYDKYITTWNTAYAAYNAAIANVDVDDDFGQSEITALEKAIADMESAYSALLSYQTSIVLSGESLTIAGIQEIAVETAEFVTSRWDAYITLIDSYGFEKSYVSETDYAATKAEMEALLGYDFATLTVDSSGETLAGLLFGSNAVEDLYVDGVISATEGCVATLFAVQAEVDEIKKDLVQYLVDKSIYTIVNEATAAESLTDMDSAQNLADIYTIIDEFAADTTNNTDWLGASFQKDVAKDGLDEALAEAFEDMITAAQDRAVEIADDLKGND